jgi:mitotic spindle assembly checkpoint protein MAD2B
MLNTQKSLLQTLCDFLTVAFHTLLYTRTLYPPNTFITTRAYNHAVFQNRHPAVCAWINNTITSIHKVLETNSVKRVVFVIFNQAGEVMERYLFDIERFPIVEKAMAWVEFEHRPEGKGKEKEREVEEEMSMEEREKEKEKAAKEKKRFSVVDIEEQLRATLNKLIYSTARLEPLPEDCTYTVAVELRDDSSALPPLAVCHPKEKRLLSLFRLGITMLTLNSILNHGFHPSHPWKQARKAIAKPLVLTLVVSKAPQYD